MNATPAQRRTNLLLFVALIVFAVSLCAAVLLWMRARTKAQGGRVYPPTALLQFSAAPRSAASALCVDFLS